MVLIPAPRPLPNPPPGFPRIPDWVPDTTFLGVADRPGRPWEEASYCPLGGFYGTPPTGKPNLWPVPHGAVGFTKKPQNGRLSTKESPQNTASRVDPKVVSGVSAQATTKQPQNKRGGWEGGKKTPGQKIGVLKGPHQNQGGSHLHPKQHPFASGAERPEGKGQKKAGKGLASSSTPGPPGGFFIGGVCWFGAFLNCIAVRKNRKRAHDF
ncbi:unnamed protein product [Coregonus sp. 'balchen']|nr:unnamed protein product [Coregonus sp. 'balchen']